MSGRQQLVRFYCERCEEEVEYVYLTASKSDWPDWLELTVKSARLHHQECCPPRRRQYRQALGLALRVKRRDE